MCKNNGGMKSGVNSEHKKLTKSQTMHCLLLDLLVPEEIKLPETLLLLEIKHFVSHFHEKLQVHHDKKLTV